MESFYKNWIKKNEEENQKARQSNLLSTFDINEPSTSASAINLAPTEPINSNIIPTPSTSASTSQENNLPLPTSPNNIIFKNDVMELYVEQTNHLRQKQFKLDDHLFHLKIKLINPSAPPPYLRDILQFLERAFNYILMNIRRHYNPQDNNIAFLTLYQKPMINGLNTGGFNIQEDSTQMVDRVLTMLEQFLVSNQTLRLDQTFKVYLKVLSLKHMVHKQTVKGKQNKKRTPEFYKNKKHYGARRKATKLYNFFWALDVPNSLQKDPLSNVFENKCLLTATILGLLQNNYFKSERVDKRFLYAQEINSVNWTKQNRAGKVLLEEMKKLHALTKLKDIGPYELQETTRLLHQFYNCQFFIFDGIHNSNKLVYMYPEEYDDSLIPIYLFQPNDNPNHVVFIRNLNSYFKANLRVCFGCKKTFSTYNYRHLCPKRKCCFSCRRFFQNTNTFVHEKLFQDFCDKNICQENSFTCNLCNITCYSLHCYKGHKKMCNGKGTFGFKCLTCNKFTYRSGNHELSLKDRHKCNEFKKCNFCTEIKDDNHLCKLTKEIVRQNEMKLAFIGIENIDNSSENCLQCMNERTVTQLLCDKHKNVTENNEDPLLVMIYYEENEKGLFSKYELNNFEDTPRIIKTSNILSHNYCEVIPQNIFSKAKSPIRKTTQDFISNYEKLQVKETVKLSDLLLQLIITWKDTTFICQDEDSICYVSIIKVNLQLGSLATSSKQS